MNAKKISLVIALLLSMCFVYSQSTIDVQIDNHTYYNYWIYVEFNQQVTPTAGSTPFYITANSTVTEHFKFNESDVNVKSATCVWENGGLTGYIYVTPGPIITVDVAPGTGNPLSYRKFIYNDYEGQGSYEHLTFLINPN